MDKKIDENSKRSCITMARKSCMGIVEKTLHKNSQKKERKII